MNRRMLVTALFLVACLGRPLASADVRGGSEYKGSEVMIDLPLEERVKNFAAPGNKAGLCVFCSLAMAARWENVGELRDIMNRLNEGGGWPEKVDRVIKEHAPDLPYVNVETNDMAFLDKAMRVGRPACITYGKGDFYGTESIAHMVLLVHLDKEKAAIIDNNDPTVVTWMTRAELEDRWTWRVDRAGRPLPRMGWVVILLAPPPPPPLRN